MSHARVTFSVLTIISRHGLVSRPCCFGSFAHGHVTRPWQLIASRVGEKNLALFSHGLMHARVPCRVVFRKLVFHDSISMLDVKN